MTLQPDQAVRYARQILLIGEEGQRRLCAASAAVDGEGFAHHVAHVYASRAGFEATTPGAIDLDAQAPRDLLASQPARELLAGARLALAEIRRAIEP